MSVRLKSSNSSERIIILRSAVLGDFIISSPALNFIREKYPSAKIFLLTIQSAHKKDRQAVKVYETKKNQPWLDFLDKKIVDEIIPLQEISLSYILCTLRNKIQNIKPTKCYILTDPLVKFKGNFLKFLLIKFLCIKCPVYGWKDFVWNKTEKKKASEKERCINHTLSCFESVLEDHSISDEDIVVKFPIVIPEEGKKQAEKIWKNFNLESKNVYVISPGGLKQHKIWPFEKYIQIIQFLLKNKDVDIIITGTSKDINIAKKIINVVKDDRVHNLVAQTDLPCLAAILSKSEMLIGNDGGTMHIGDAVGCSVVAIMPGIELPKTVEPWHNIKNALRKHCACSPCYDFDECPMGTYECMKQIEVDEVISAIKNAKLKKFVFNNVRIHVDRSKSKINLRIIE